MSEFATSIRDFAQACADLAPIVDQTTRVWLLTQWRAGGVSELNQLRKLFGLPTFDYVGFPATEPDLGWWCAGKQLLQYSKLGKHVEPERLAPRRERLILRSTKNGEAIEEESFMRGLEVAAPASEHHFTIGADGWAPEAAAGNKPRWHRFQTFALSEDGIHTGRRRHLVVCKTCEALVHSGTTGPVSMARDHVAKLEEQKL